MRVIAGTSRGRRLATFTGHDIRPTPDRVREALFSILQSKLDNFAGLRVLDLFAGSGALSIEALSRGAASTCLVEMAPAAAKLLRENLNLCHFATAAEVIIKDVFQALTQLKDRDFDLIFLDPPYGQGLANRTLAEIERLKLLGKNGILCAETGTDETFPLSVGHLQRIDQRRYGTTMINFFTWS